MVLTNKDKYLKDGVDVYELVNNMGLLYMSGYSYHDNLTYFFNHEVKPILTEDEKVILNRIRNFYTHIKRTNAGLKITSGTLGAELGLPFNMFDDNLFQFIQPRRRI